MKIVDISAEFVHATPYPLQVITDMGRICYQADPREPCSFCPSIVTEGLCKTCGGHGFSLKDAEAFTRMLIRRGHFSVLEHVTVGIKLIVDRGITHEAVRHRLASFSQESTRFCNYLKESLGREIQVIEPPWLNPGRAHDIWHKQMLSAEEAYMDLVAIGEPPEYARSVLPTCLKAEIGMTANVREWRHVIGMRYLGVAGRPHPQMKQAMALVLNRLMGWCPVLFEDVLPGVGNASW